MPEVFTVLVPRDRSVGPPYPMQVWDDVKFGMEPQHRVRHYLKHGRWMPAPPPVPGHPGPFNRVRGER